MILKMNMIMKTMKDMMKKCTNLNLDIDYFFITIIGIIVALWVYI